MANNLSFSQQGSFPVNPTGGLTQPSWQNLMNSVQSNYNANPIKTTSIPTNTGSNNQSVIPGLLSTLKTQGGTHSTTDAAGNTQTIKINPLDPAQNPTGSANTTSNGVTTGVFPPGSPENAGPAPKPTLTPTTLPNGQQGFVNQQGDFVDANGNSIPASNNSNQSGNSPTSFPGLIGAAASSAGNNSAIGQSAADIAKSYGQQIADTGVQGARAQAGYKTTGTTPVGEGNAAIQAQSTAAQQTALATGESAALAGTGQQLTAQGQQTTGLLGAAGAVKPEGNFPFVFNPATGTFTAPGVGGTSGSTGTQTGAPTLTYNPQTDSQSLAQAVMNGQIGYSDAITALSYGSNASAAPGQLSSAIIALGGNPTNLQAKAGAVAGGVTGNVQDTQAIAGAQNNIDSITSLITSGNLNPSKINLANEGIQAIQQNLSNSDYQTLLNGLQSIDAALSKVTGSPVDIATLSSTQGTSLIATINNQVAYAKGIAAGKVQNNSTGSSSGSTSGANPWH